MSDWWNWVPATVLAAGALLTFSVQKQKPMPLAIPLKQAIPMQIGEYSGEDRSLSEAELELTRVTDYVRRVYTLPDSSPHPRVDIYVGYYDNQRQGKTIHSPKNCLPGTGWEAVASGRTTVALDGGVETVNRYLVRREQESALVLYWYQGRGRVAASEYAVKWDLLRDAALEGRSEEALVRVAVPIGAAGEDRALSTAQRIASGVMASLDQALP